jgi:hypothetical protein
MAAVSVDQGMPGPEESAHKVDRSRWQLLAMARRRWAEIDLPFDCRLLRTVVDEAPMLAEGLGMESGDRFLTDYLSLDLDLVGRVLGWLEQEQPAEAVPLAVALVDHGGDRKSDNFKASQERQDQFDIVNLKGGNQAAYLQARLRRDAPEVAEALERGEHRSIRAAAIEAGIIKPVPTVRLVPDPTRAAASIVERMDRPWCVALATAIAEQIRDVASKSPPPAP